MKEVINCRIKFGGFIINVGHTKFFAKPNNPFCGNSLFHWRLILTRKPKGQGWVNDSYKRKQQGRSIILGRPSFFDIITAWLYTRFSVWYALAHNQKDNKLLRDYTEGWSSDEEGGLLREEAKKNLSLEVSMELDRVQVFSEYNRGRFVLGIRTQSLLDVAYFHLANLITLPLPHVKLYLKDCKNPRCGRLFWADHGRKRYCEFCDRRIVHKQQKEGK